MTSVLTGRLVPKAKTQGKNHDNIVKTAASLYQSSTSVGLLTKHLKPGLTSPVASAGQVTWDLTWIGVSLGGAARERKGLIRSR